MTLYIPKSNKVYTLNQVLREYEIALYPRIRGAPRLHYCMCVRLHYAGRLHCARELHYFIFWGFHAPEIALFSNFMQPRLHCFRIPLFPKTSCSRYCIGTENRIVPKNCMSTSIIRCSNFRYTVSTCYLYSEGIIIQRRLFFLVGKYLFMNLEFI